MIPNFKEILDELSYRVDGGIPNLTKESHVNHLIDILRENRISDAAHLANKARVYFSYLNEASPKKGDAGLEAAAEKFQNKRYKTSKGGEVSFTTAINYGYQGKENDSAHIAAMNDFETFVGDSHGKYGTMEKPKQPDEPTGKLGASDYVSKAEKQPTKKAEPTKKKETKGLTLSPEESKRLVYDKKTLADIVKSGLIPSSEKKLSGAGVFDASEEDMRALLEVTEMQVQDPNYRRPLPKYDVSDTDIDTAVNEMKNLLGKDFARVKSLIQKAGGVAPELTTGERGVQRFRDIIKLYLQTGGRSAVTGKIVPFNQMQLDHHVPYSSAASIVADKKKKGIKSTLLDEQSRLDSLPNWDLMETSLNQLKNSLEGNELIAKINKKLSASPEEKELKKLQQEVQNIREAKLLENLVNSFGKGDFSGMNEETIENMSGDEIDIVMKAWNWWHPNVRDANQFRGINPNYDKILAKAGIKVPPPDDKNTIIRNTSQGPGGSRSRGVKRPVPERKKVTIQAMRGAKVPALTKKETKQTDTVLLRAVRDVEKLVKDKTSKIDQLKQKLKANKKK
jgi:hypothetical protein